MINPPVFLIPSSSTDLSLTRTLNGGDYRHFISEREFKLWAKTHPSIRPSGPTSTGTEPPNSTTLNSTNSTNAASYKAPEHPVSHLLKTIPPRAPSRSTRSNILAYTLHLAISSRLSAYLSTTGTSSILHRAEARDASHSSYDSTALVTALDEEAKAAGLFKLGKSLLRESRRQAGDALPNSVERRVALATLAEDLLATPEADLVIVPVTSDDLIRTDEVDALKSLSILTSPNTTTLYTAISAPKSARNPDSSIAQSLIDMKFGSSSADDPTPTSSSTSFAGMGDGPGSSSSKLTAAPHMDYRIVRGQALRTRAQDLFSTSILPTSSSYWCRRHRVDACVICSSTSISTSSSSSTKTSPIKRTSLPGQGLESSNLRKRPVAELIPSFLILSASLLKDLRERAAAYETESLEYTVNVVQDAEVNVTAAWYALLHQMLIQACLEGYLVDGWMGLSGIEVLFGCGCGVWEGRGWASRVAAQSLNHSQSQAAAAAAKMDVESSSDESGSSSDDESDSEDEDDENEQLADRMKLIEAAQALFGTRGIAQADYERSMRDRRHEFFNIPEDESLASHLIRLNSKYPLSSFESTMVDFIESATKLLGRPALAKYEAAASTTTTTNQITPSGEPDPYALTRWFCRPETDVEPEPKPISKRRRMD